MKNIIVVKFLKNFLKLKKQISIFTLICYEFDVNKMSIICVIFKNI